MNKSVILKLNGKCISAKEGARLSEYTGGDLPCGGHGKCGKCKVYASGNLSPLSETELMRLTKEEIENGIRLACLTEIIGDCEVNEIKRASDAQIVTDGAAYINSQNPAFSEYGAAIDIGTTTLAAKLFDRKGTLLSEASALNPQSAFGADVISRIEASLAGNGKELARLILNAIDELLSELSSKASIDPQLIDGAVITGNTAMLHLLTNTSPEPLSHAPFAAERLFGEVITAKELGAEALSPDASIYLPPCIAAFVGADTTCAIIASELCEGSGSALLTDIGTNGEMALIRNGELHVCSTAAGPAFEGVGISMGMRGGIGAIDKVILKNGEPFAHVIGNIAPVGICGSGLVDAIACLLMNETLDETGYLDDDTVEISDPVVLTQQDIRMVQLAKSAICAGIRTLLHKSKITADDISVFYLAGGFGSYLDIKNAGSIGLIPNELTSKVKVIGNAALTGAAMLLLDKELRDKASAITKNVKVADLATDPFFAEEYMTGMLFE